ncbi:hypothetical protein BGW36DRAFT_393339 [Talaromyces proteolyticus]|uniref:NAD-dependent epimerase/dehydratase domain-containing protein n=1 Tax=Talaromyces proteolyticus TaxID=1131652 RepID=A0AAD4L767_9EURO|nr:uncharacterized protein BGW36DRAFT_393339 [Talaromyces proteolyticus]KAH8705845.1 hypothetical protein BGW36DRAFT_393339 [Talaromyces proteolyticus]
MENTNKTILITSASAYLPSHILRIFLEAGYNVRVAVKTDLEARTVRDAHPGYDDSRVSFVHILDIIKEGAFDVAVKNVHGVIHTAFPAFPFNTVEFEKRIVIPAIDSIYHLLQSVHRHGPTVTRVIIMSSFAAMINVEKGLWPEHMYNESDWNPDTYQVATGTRIMAQAQFASRKLSEKTAWNYMRKEKPMFDLVSLCVPVAWGPLTIPTPSLSCNSDLGSGVRIIHNLMHGSFGQTSGPDNFYPFVDVRDVAIAALKAYQVAHAADERFFLASGRATVQMLCDILHVQFPELRHRLPMRQPEMGGLETVYDVDGSKAERILGFRYRGLLEAVADTAICLLEMERKEAAEKAEGLAKLAAAF